MRRLANVLIIFMTVALVSGAVLAGMARQASSSSIKDLMGDNFQNIQVILYNLITARYDRVPEQIRVIHQHAVELPQKVPETAKSDFEKRTFVTYAYQLESHTSNMLTVLDELNKRDKMQADPGKQNIDYLRVVAARQFGEIVATCVLCHNQFRRNPPK
jgi:hypothetical protein